MFRNTVMAVAIIFSSSLALAQGAAPEGPWKGALSLGYLGTSGNTETTSYSTKFGIGYETGDWIHTFNASANGAGENKDTTAEAYKAGWKTEYSLNEKDFLFGTVDWRKDRFSGVDQQLTEAIGYGRHLIDTPTHQLSAGLGVGHRSADLADGTSESGVVGRGNIDYEWIFSETAGFNQAIVVESGSDNTYMESISALRARLMGDFALVLSYTIKKNTDVPVGSEKTDTISAVSIEYAF